MVRFGPSGNEDTFYNEKHKHSFEAPKWLSEKGLSAYEVSFGRGFIMGDETAKKIGEEGRKYNVLISAHAPYYINLANPNEEMIQKSFWYFERGLELLSELGGTDYVVHLGSCGKLDRKTALELIKKNLKRVIDILKEKDLLGNGIRICPETMGKPQQIGTYEEIIDLCTLDECLVPTFDFGHINALTGGSLKSYEDYKKILDLAYHKLGERAKTCHIHFSKIEYGAKGEIRHLDFDDEVYGPEFKPLARVIKDMGFTPTIISESKSRMMTDSLIMKNIYDRVCNDNKNN